MKKFVFILPKKGEYYFDYLDLNKVCVDYYYKKLNIFERIFCKFNKMIVKSIPFLAFFNTLACRVRYGKKIMSYFKDYNVASLDAYLEVDLLYYIKKKNIPFKLAIWNSLSDDRINMYLKYIPKSNIYAYSIEDSTKYGLKHINDFYLIDLPKFYQINENPENDLFYMGRDKGRFEIISFITHVLKEKGFKCQIQILSNKDYYDSEIEYFRKYKSFDEYIHNLLNSKILLDITINHNITFRTIESFVFEKKLISNNKKLKEMDFYNKNNIYIFDEDKFDEKEFDEFLQSPFISLSDEIKKRYDFYTIYSFIEGEFEK